MEFFRPTPWKFSLSLVFYFLIYSGLDILASLCLPLNYLGAALMTRDYSVLQSYPCGYISQFLAFLVSLASNTNLYFLQFLQGLYIFISYFLSCLSLFILHKLKEQ